MKTVEKYIFVPFLDGKTLYNNVIETKEEVIERYNQLLRWYQNRKLEVGCILASFDKETGKCLRLISSLDLDKQI